MASIYLQDNLKIEWSDCWQKCRFSQ